MFWKRARQKYGHLTENDKDIKKYLNLTGEFQSQGYQGVVGSIQDLGHKWISSRTPKGPILEIGFGTGRHSKFFAGKLENYFVSDYSERFTNSDVWSQFIRRGICCDVRYLPYQQESFTSVISVYNLGHISDLNRVFEEVNRVLMKEGVFLVAIPCEGGFLWNLGREITTRRMFIKKYGINYDKVIAFEHVWDLPGVKREILRSELFKIDEDVLLLFYFSTHHLNLINCISLVKRP